MILASPDPTEAPKPAAGFFAKLGPGLVTGAADDDPSGIATYSVVGAQFGYSPLWTAWFIFPLMAAVQLICARLGLVGGRGLAGLLRERYGRWIVWPAVSLLVVANVVNIGADLGSMADSTGLVTGLPAYWFTPIYTVLMIILMAKSSYRRIAQLFKWMTLVLFAYVIAGFCAHPDWQTALKATLIPHIALSGPYLTTFVALLGTSISPYLLFWQSNQEVEEKRSRFGTGRGQSGAGERRDAAVDVIAGMLLSNLIMYFIILTTAATLHAHGLTNIETTQQAAQALRPLAGHAAYLLFTLGIVGTGMLSVPVLAGSTAYAIAESGKWRASLKDRPAKAPQFYLVLCVALVGGFAMNFFKIGVVAMLYWSAVVNGVLAPPLVALAVMMSADRKVMGRHVSRGWLLGLGWATAAIMAFAAVAMFATLGRS